MAGAGVIDRYLEDLAGSLYGSPARKSDLLAEARDSLDDATERYLSAGLPEEEAQRRAVTDFGAVEEVREDYQSELGLATGVQALRSLALALPLMHVLWELTRMTTFGSWSNVGVAMPEWYGPLALTADYTGYAVAGLGLVALLVARVLCRYARSARAGRWISLVAATSVGADLLVRVALVSVSGFIDTSLLLISWPCAVMGLLSMMISARLVVLARRSWRACVTIVA
ncbi:permease prefix domain 1-containing protein [Amycolatopsis lurida]